jgi:hypothetical protein
VQVAQMWRNCTSLHTGILLCSTRSRRGAVSGTGVVPVRVVQLVAPGKPVHTAAVCDQQHGRVCKRRNAPRPGGAQTLSRPRGQCSTSWSSQQLFADGMLYHNPSNSSNIISQQRSISSTSARTVSSLRNLISSKLSALACLAGTVHGKCHFTADDESGICQLVPGHRVRRHRRSVSQKTVAPDREVISCIQG